MLRQVRIHGLPVELRPCARGWVSSPRDVVAIRRRREAEERELKVTPDQLRAVELWPDIKEERTEVKLKGFRLL